jgi:hypothetical protein
MNKLKLILTMALTSVVLFAQAGTVAAAPQTQTATPITGTIQSITTETDAAGVTTVLVTVLDDQGTTQTVRLSVETAASLLLLQVDGTGQPILDPVTNLPLVDDSQVDQLIVIDPTTVIPDVNTEEESVNPISALLASFFGEDASVIDGYHDDGFGFGVIAQALWMSQNLTGTEDVSGDASLALEILQAKQDKDFESFFETHPEIILDGAIPTNWGQFRKAVLNKKNNLGVIVSGHAEDPSDLSTQPEHGNGNGNNNGNGNGNGSNNGNGHGQGNSQNVNKDKGKNK